MRVIKFRMPKLWEEGEAQSWSVGKNVEIVGFFYFLRDLTREMDIWVKIVQTGTFSRSGVKLE